MEKNIDQIFKRLFGTSNHAIHHYHCPGRLNFIGEHLDYNGGSVMPFAIELGIDLYIRPNQEMKFRMFSSDFEKQIILPSDTEKIQYSKDNGWGNYPLGIIEILKQKGFSFDGYDFYFKSNLPTGAGLSSSAAIEVLTAFALLDLAAEKIDRTQIALWAKEAENNFIGVACGIMDQFAVAMGKNGHLICLNCETMDYSYVPVNLDGYSILILNTKTSRSLEHSYFNTRRAECEEAENELNKNGNSTRLAHADLKHLDIIPSENARKRAQHVISEQSRVIAMKDAISGDIDLVAGLINASHLSLKNDFEVTGEYLDRMQEIALRQDGCIASRMTGAGFAGCGLAIVENEKVSSFKNVFVEQYKDALGFDAEVYTCNPQNGVHKVGEI